MDLEGEAERAGFGERKGLCDAGRLGDMELIGSTFFGCVEETPHTVVKGFDGGDGVSAIIADIAGEIERFVVDLLSCGEVDAVGEAKGAVSAFGKESDVEAFDDKRKGACNRLGDTAFFDQDVE